jgi:serine/threonine-protein kinase
MSGTVRDPALPARTVPLDPGEILGEAPDSRWRVVRHVADGGFSSVYEVRPATPETLDRHGGAPRALKCVWGTPAELTAMNSEAARTQLVDGHPGVLTLVTSFRFERSTAPHHHVGLVLELADEDLPTFGTRVRPDERAWAAVFEQVAAGLEHIHARRVVHGDIKPTNVLRIGGRFAVADFGVSAPLESTRSAGIGLARTIAFWPPESATQGVLQADGVRRPPVEGWRASQLGDVWALAVSAHRMLTGRHITAGTTPEQQYELVCLGRYAVDGRLGPGWRRLLEDCLVQDPQRRRVTTSAQFRQRLAELAVPPAYAGVPWPVGSPRLAALVDLDPAAGGPLLALSLDRPGGRVSGELVPADGVLPAALLHLTEDVLPALAGRPAPGLPNGVAANGVASNGVAPNGAAPNGAASNGAASNGAAPNGGPNGVVPGSVNGVGVRNGAARTVALPAGAVPNGVPAGVGPNGAPASVSPNGVPAGVGPLGGTAVGMPPGNAAAHPATGDPAATQIVTLAELERTRQQSAAVSAQRDQLAADRDRLARSRDAAIADRDRLRRDHDALARRLDRLEREAGLRRPAVPERERTAVLAPARREPTLTMAPARREPTAAYEPTPAAPQSRPSTSDRRPSTSDPTPTRPRRQSRIVRRLLGMVRRLIALVVVTGVLAVLAVVGAAALFNSTPNQVMNRVVVIVDQVRGAGS